MGSQISGKVKIFFSVIESVAIMALFT